jgi:hypothetical protein
MSIEILKLDKVVLPKSVCVLFSGRMGVGKTLCSNIAKTSVNDAGMTSTVLSFAYDVKKIARTMGWNGIKDARGRALLQGVGRIGRDYDKDCWVKSSFKRAEETSGYPFDFIFVDDWRFPNEAIYIKEHEPLYHVVEINIISDTYFPADGIFGTDDASETSLENHTFDYIIDNNSDTLHLHNSIVQVLNRVSKELRSSNR